MSSSRIGSEQSDKSPITAPWEPDYVVHLTCPECKEDPPNIIEEYSAEDTVCASCGLVLGERIVDTRSEWRNLGDGNEDHSDPVRTGDPQNLLLNGSELEAIISPKGGAADISLQRAHKANTGVKEDKSLLQSYAKINRLCESTEITMAVSQCAKTIFKQINDAKALRGKPLAATIASCILIACRQCSVPRTFREISSLTKVPKKRIGRTFKLVESFLRRKAEGETTKTVTEGQQGDFTAIGKPHEYTATQHTNAESLVVRFCSNVGYDTKMTLIVEQLLARVTQLGVTDGKSPPTFIGVCIYAVGFLMGCGNTFTAVADAIGISSTSVSVGYKLLLRQREAVFDAGWVVLIGGDVGLLPGQCVEAAE